ncbi:hypothetical protein A8B78_07110 [Jannaschia sp. EhC01]|nr:hypothetical protein A8B78_07110 [Jannaschia sp. EhC01]
MKNWDEMAAPWLRAETRMEAAHGPVLDALLERAALASGARVLDIGIGNGLSTLRAAEAVGQGGTVLGVDISPPFVARAAERLPQNAQALIVDAEAADWDETGFGQAISLFGTMFFTDTAAAFANIRRAMAPGGQFTFVAWAPPASNPWLSISGQAVTEVLGPADPRADPNAPGPFRFALPEVALTALDAAGWQAEVETLPLTLTPNGTAEEIAATQMELGVAASRIAGEGPDAEEVEAIADAIASRFRQMQTKAGAVKVPARVHFFTAVA